MGLVYHRTVSERLLKMHIDIYLEKIILERVVALKKYLPAIIFSLIVLFVVVVSALVYLRPQISSGPRQEVQGSLVSGFPSVPLYPKAVVQSSYTQVVKGNTVYGATWTVTEVNGHSTDRASVREIMHWYEDDAFPFEWFFDQPLQEGGIDPVNPTKSWLTVSKDGTKIALTVERTDPKGPVLIEAVISKK
ncbi:MAG TPA: hypothetical protein VLH19_04010 [Patescibacteria group bacterium]|nr:hypothetical protein [Patescibacteria group bacterium]